jgi:hypothetical protein
MAERLGIIRPHVARLCELVDGPADDAAALDGIDAACQAIEQLCDTGGVPRELALSIRHSLWRLRRLPDAHGHMIYASCVGEKVAQLRDYLELHPLDDDA